MGRHWKVGSSADLGSAALLFGIVENNAHGMPFAGTHSADAVPQIDPITRLSALHWTFVHGNSETVADNPIPPGMILIRTQEPRSQKRNPSYFPCDASFDYGEIQ